jgi:hypothetical protein
MDESNVHSFKNPFVPNTVFHGQCLGRDRARRNQGIREGCIYPWGGSGDVDGLEETDKLDARAAITRWEGAETLVEGGEAPRLREHLLPRYVWVWWERQSESAVRAWVWWESQRWGTCPR